MSEKNEFETIYDRLKKIRTDRKISQDFLAKKLGLTQKAYSKIENNETKLNVEILQRISEILNVPLIHFFQNSDLPMSSEFENDNEFENASSKKLATENKDVLYQKLLDAKDEIIQSKLNEIESLKLVLNKLYGG